ncbi:MAG: xanthine dehydrogenase family protein molybdopterin-binding subunit [Thermodesulfobacteriota bacterium]|nr:xanthine dehydrogenase family protein molybdopterin-binding subunit [Thermodesulfobacteriota bacterium]
MAEYSTVGKRVPKKDSGAMVTGEAKFAADITLSGMLHGKVLYSPYPHAKILNIDTSKAERLPGVKAVITGKETPRKPFELRWGLEADDKDTYIMTADRVRYTGDGLAAVAAIDEDTAEEALELIEVEYEILPILDTIEKAMAPGAVRIQDYAERNILETRAEKYGDVEKGFQESDYVREDMFKFPITAYMHPETMGCVVSYDSASDRYTFWSGAAWAYTFRSVLSVMLDVPWQRIKIITPFIGASFGGRGTWIYPSHLCGALLSKKTGRPVKIVNTREEDVLHRCAYHKTLITVKTGVKKDGTAVAREASIVYDIGAYSGFEAKIGTIINFIWFHVPFVVPNFKADVTMVFTNNPPHGPFRSYGNIQPIVACELQLELIARELGIDPMVVKMKNTVTPYSTTPLGWETKSCGMNECIEKSGKAINWEERGEKLPKGRGKGIGTASFPSPRGGRPDNPLTANVIVNSDGTADLHTIGTDSGSGQYCAMSQIVAEELGIPFDDVTRTAVDTDVSLDRENQSIVTISTMGRAPQLAAIDARKKILEVMADKMEANVLDMESKGGRVYVKGSPEKGVSFAEAATIAIAERGSIVGKGEYVSPAWDKGPDYVLDLFKRFGIYGDIAGSGYGAAAADVEVDMETGKIRILSLAHAYDIGFALNPLLIEAQLEGGAALSISKNFSEEVLIDEGQILNPTYLNYRTITALEMPPVIPIIVETESDPSEGPYGAKEMGMGVLMSAGPAVASAIYNATGVMIKEFPATSERILRALQAKK